MGVGSCFEHHQRQKWERFVKVYAVADIHGNLEKYELIKTQVLKLNPDILVIAGDAAHKTTPLFFNDLLDDLPIPVIAVRGESDIQVANHPFDERPSIISTHLKTASCEGVSFIGLNGVTRRMLGIRHSYSREVIKAAEHLVNGKSVVVTHLPPRGCLDETFFGFHSGCKHLYELLVSRQPAALICGHLYNGSKITYLGKTLVVNCSVVKNCAGAMINFIDGEVICADIL